jgi:transcriptional regulator with XRE-family HTH domain
VTHDDIRRQDLSDFLRTRRARISPAGIRFPAAHRRRTPGLRREEVAQLAGMSATWYTWLEQRRPISVSPGMLDNLACVLQLNPVERIQLFRLARREPAIDSTPQREAISPRFQRMLDQSDIMPSFVMGRRWDVLGWNRAARGRHSASRHHQSGFFLYVVARPNEAENGASRSRGFRRRAVKPRKQSSIVSDRVDGSRRKAKLHRRGVQACPWTAGRDRLSSPENPNGRKLSAVASILV